MSEKLELSMAGSGSWRRWFPDDSACALYERIYPRGVRLDQLTEEQRRQVQQWQAPGFVGDEDGVVVPLVPVFTNEDASELATWFSRATEQAVAVIIDRIGAYRDLADALSGESQAPFDYLLTILLCAHTLDSGTLEHLHEGILGNPPSRAGSGQYFIWGQTADNGQAYSFGVNSFPWTEGAVISLIQSPSVARTVPNRHTIAVPVFDSATMQRVEKLCGPTSRRLAEVFSNNVTLLEDRLARCSFARCSRADVLCMLFHLGYPRVAGELADARLLPAFPDRAEDAWGVWIRTYQRV